MKADKTKQNTTKGKSLLSCWPVTKFLVDDTVFLCLLFKKHKFQSGVKRLGSIILP